MTILSSTHGVIRNIVRISRAEVFDAPPLLRANASISQHGSATAVNIDIVIGQEVPHLKINGALTIRSKDGEGQAALYNNTINVCDFLLQPSRNRLLQVVRQEIMYRGNIPTRCPIRAGKYIVRNATFAKAHIPSFLPASYFRVDINLLNGNPVKMIMQSYWYGKFIKA
ncbi:uncharacterized protein LOC126567618 [Anopheles maculipalpis]|uniref:uncharacterized protein LOC126567618 n=1 Tax=Anopheles maculipalpis TaxID=1496333 RepID=UPI0021591BCC|nr:uncharacterized protein LOC126567618 [Anopheles maculipalpis]